MMKRKELKNPILWPPTPDREGHHAIDTLLKNKLREPE